MRKVFLFKNLSNMFIENTALNKLNVRCSIPFQDKESHVQLLHKHFASLLLSFSNIMHNVTLELKELVCSYAHIIIHGSPKIIIHSDFALGFR